MSRCHDKDIRDLSIQDTFGASDLVPVNSGSNRDDRSVTGQAILDYVVANNPVAQVMVTQYSSPTATGFTATIEQVNGVSVPVWMRATPTGAFAAGTLVLPPDGVAVDGQEILFTTSQAITTLTLIAVGSNLTYSFYTLGANGFFRHRYDAPSNTWVPVG